MKILILTLSFLFTAPVFARLGESSQICAQRYGEPTQLIKKSDNAITAIYSKNNLTIICLFIDNICQLIIFGNNKEFTSEEIITLKNANAPGAGWEQEGDNFIQKENGAVKNFLTFRNDGKTLIFGTAAALQWNAQDNLGKLEGF